MNHTEHHGGVNHPSDDRLVGLLLDELRGALDSPALDYLTPPQRLSGGFWADMFVVELSRRPEHLPATLVARIAPDAELSSWETAMQSGVAAQGFPTPMVHLSGGPDGPIGRAWSLMDVAAGRPLLGGLSGVSALARLPRLATRLPDQLARITARLHQVDTAMIHSGLDDVTGRGNGLDGLLDHLEARAGILGDERIDAALSRLRGTQPSVAKVVVCHGDLHPFNVLADGDRLTLLDWTAAQFADPTYDLAFTALLVSTPPLDAPGPLRPVISAAARWVAARFLARYEHHTGNSIDRDRLAWHTTLHATRILCDVTSWRAEGQRGGHPWFALAPAMEFIVDEALEA